MKNTNFVEIKTLRINGTVDAQRVGQTQFTSLLANFRPRPETDYTKTVGCHRCGKVVCEPSKLPAHQVCPCSGIANAGIRFKGREELIWWAEIWDKLGYNDVAQKAREIANKMP